LNAKISDTELFHSIYVRVNSLLGFLIRAIHDGNQSRQYSAQPLY
jgi:hypothetical protein